MRVGVIIVLIILIVCIWVYEMQYAEFDAPIAHYEELDFKTGDLVIFKATNNYNSIFHGSYFGHVGMVYVSDNNNVLLFEANNKSVGASVNGRGVYLTPLRDRINTYIGNAFLKPLNKRLSNEQCCNLVEFMRFALELMYYNHSVFRSGLRKYFGLQKYNYGTDCGQLMFLAMIKLGLIDWSEFNNRMMHNLLYVINVTRLNHGFQYSSLANVTKVLKDHIIAK